MDARVRERKAWHVPDCANENRVCAGFEQQKKLAPGSANEKPGTVPGFCATVEVEIATACCPTKSAAYFLADLLAALTVAATLLVAAAVALARLVSNMSIDCLTIFEALS